MTTSTATLKTAMGTYGHTKALKEGSIKLNGYELDQVEVTPIIAAFRRMSRTLEFDISEMAITTYLTAKRYNLPFTAIPVFVARGSSTPILYNTQNDMKSPKDLEGHRVGVRAYTVTSGVWSRGMLKSEYGVDLDKVTWVLADEEHVAEFHKDAPPNAEYKVGANLGEILTSGEIDAALGPGHVEASNVKPLIPNIKEVETNWSKKTRIFPINHMIVIKDSIIASNPDLPVELFKAFKASKEKWLTQFRSATERTPAEQELVERMEMMGGSDPFPYGINANRTTLEAVIRFANEQHIITKQMKPEELFVPSTVNLE